MYVCVTKLTLHLFRWAGYMSGAVESGQRAAREVLRAFGRQAYLLTPSQLNAVLHFYGLSIFSMSKEESDKIAAEKLPQFLPHGVKVGFRMHIFTHMCRE